MYGSKTREQQLEDALQALVDLFDEEVLIVNADGDSDARSVVEETIEAAGIALTLDDEGPGFDDELEAE